MSQPDAPTGAEPLETRAVEERAADLYHSESGDDDRKGLCRQLAYVEAELSASRVAHERLRADLTGLIAHIDVRLKAGVSTTYPVSTWAEDLHEIRDSLAALKEATHGPIS